MKPSEVTPPTDSKLRMLLLFIAVVIVFAFISLLYILWSSRQDALEKAEVSALNYSKVLQVRFNETLHRIDAIMRISAKRFPPEVMLPDAEKIYASALNTMLQDQILDFPEISGIRILDAKGDLRYAAPTSNIKNINSADRDFFIAVRDNPKLRLYFSKVITSRITGKQVIVISQALRDAQGNFYGIISSGVALDQIQKHFQQLNIGKDGAIVLRHADSHTLITRWPHNPIWINQALSPNHPVAQNLQAGQTEFVLHTVGKTDGTIRVVGTNRLDHYPFYISTALNRNEILANWREQVLMFSLTAGGVLILLLGLMLRLWQSHSNEIKALSNLAENQARISLLARVFEYSGEAIMLLDRDHRILEVNLAYTMLTGYTIEQVRRQSWANIFLEQPMQVQTAAQRKPGQRYFWQGELICTRKDGGTFPVLHTSSSILDASGEIAYVIVNFSDITERKRIEQLKSEFVSTVSHELRTPLTSISGALGLIIGGALGETPERIKQMIDLAHKNSQRLSHLINDLLDMEKLVAGKMTLTMTVHTLMPLIEATLESNHPYAAQHQVQFVLAERDDTVSVLVDPDRLQQVLSNLLSNAAKFSPKHQQVEVAVRRCSDQVRVEVTDHGNGVPTKFHHQIFQKFAQADSANTRQQGGTGLGLAISKELIDRMGGRIGFTTIEGQGATFYFELPIQTSDLQTNQHNRQLIEEA